MAMKWVQYYGPLCLILTIISLRATAGVTMQDADSLVDWAMLSAMDAADSRLSHTPIRRASSDNATVCYPYIGCFSKEDGAMKHVTVMPESPEEIGTKFELYRRTYLKKIPRFLSYEDDETLKEVDPLKPIIVITHGFGGVKEDITDLFNAVLEKEDANIIFVNWERGAEIPYYPNAAVNSEVVGRQIGVLLLKLIREHNMTAQNMHFIGFSLGAHVAGFTGKYLREHGELLGRITGLDPAGPLFERYGPHVHLSKADAHYVDVIHTSAGTIILFGDVGITKSIGHVDFYPNGGKSQPGCFYFTACSHKRSLVLYTESIERCKFVSYPCPFGYEGFEKGRCNGCGDHGCGLLGHYSNLAQGRGDQFLKTAGDSPLCNIK